MPFSLPLMESFRGMLGAGGHITRIPAPTSVICVTPGKSPTPLAPAPLTQRESGLGELWVFFCFTHL